MIALKTKQAIANATGKPKQIAEQYSVSVSSVYNYRNRYADTPTAEIDPMRADATIFDQSAKSGLIRFGAEIHEEFLRELQDDGGAKLYTEMANHPVVAAVLFAIQMAQRKVKWFVEPASDDETDQEAAEFLEECRDDMSQTWDDIVSQVFTMLKYGFSAAEIVYKKRLGAKPPKYTEDPAGSRFDDGKIGWRRWQFMSPRTLAPGGRWQFDEQGRILSLTQQPPPMYGDITVPIQKLLLFRTRVEWDNPEGYPILRPMYTPWYYANNLAEIEAITAERVGAGFPVMYLGNDTKKGATNSDLTAAINYVKNVRNDEQMGLALPYAKMGTAGEGMGILFEFVSPPGKGAVDFDKVINRYEKRMAQVVLAQFIFLGMTGEGTQALASTTVDVFQEAIAAWSTMLADVINRFAIPRLFALNPFKVDALPKLKHSEASVPNLTEIASYVNTLVGAQIIMPDEQLEKHLRAMADLPEKPEEAVEIVEPGQESPEPDLDEGEADESIEVEEEPEESAEPFALKTIRGALARNEQGKFERGGGAPIDDRDVARADALLNNRMTPAQASQFQAAGLVGERGGKKFLTPEGRGVARLMATNPRAALARMRTALRKAKPGRAKTTSIKPGAKRPGVKVAAKGGKGGGKGKGKGKAKKKGGGGGGGSAKPEEKAKLNTAQEEKVNALVEAGVPENLAVALSLIYDSGGPNAAARGQDPEIVKGLQELGLLGENDKGEPVVSEDGVSLTKALGNDDLDLVEKILEDKFSEDFIVRTRSGGPKWERETNAYERQLRSEYNSWAAKTAKELVDADEDEFQDRLDDAIIALTLLLTRLGRSNLPGAFQLGLADVPASPDGIMKLSEAVRSNDDFLKDSLAPDIEAKVRAAVEQDALIAEDPESLQSVLGTFTARVGSYAGTFWSLIMWGFGDRVRQDPDDPRVRWVRDNRAAHCPDCLQFGRDEGKVYDSFDEMLAVTGGMMPQVGVQCSRGGNCRCWLEEEVKPGVWVRQPR